jgi:hypothetical protein
MSILVFLHPLGVFYLYLVYFVVIWYTFSQFGTLHQGKSGNPEAHQNSKSVAPFSQNEFSTRYAKTEAFRELAQHSNSLEALEMSILIFPFSEQEYVLKITACLCLQLHIRV